MNSIKTPASLFFPLRAAIVMGCLTILPFAMGQEFLETIRKVASEEIEAADTDVLFKKLELAKKYAAALDTLEKKLAAEGDLDAIVRLREEKELVGKSGDTTAHNDKPLVELREKYVSARDAIGKEMDAARVRAAAGIAARIRVEEAALAKAGKVDEALALRKEGERLILELGGAASAAIPFADDPRSTALMDLKPLEVIEFPKDDPPVDPEALATQGRWLKSLTVPATKQRLRENILIGDRGKSPWVTVVVSPGSVWSGTDQYILANAGKFIASKSRFENLRLQADHACRLYFSNCLFEDCALQKGGWWRGGELEGKIYMEGCVIRKRLSNRSINIVQDGFRVENSVFENADLPTMDFRKRQPADYVNNGWLRFVNCRFVNCKIPSSFLLLTRDCIFENCIFIDSARHKDEADITKSIEVVLYVYNCKNRIAKLPDQVTFTEKPLTDLKGVTIPTAASLLSLIDR